MHRLLASRLIAALAAIAALPASAHVTTSAMPHWHADDAWGVLAVFALTASFAWVVRGRR
jgi:hypothetical protein